MHDQLAEKFAELFAKCAATGDTAELHKEAAAHALVKEAGIEDVLTNPLLLAPLGGAAVGGVTGYYGTKKDKNKKRNAAIGALTGGLGGLSGAIAFGGKPIDGSSEGGPNDWTTNALKAPSRIADMLGITGGAVAGGKFLGGVADKYFPAHAGELKRLAKQPGVVASAVGKATKGKAPTNPYAKPLQQLFDRYERAGVRVENLMPAGSSSDAIARAKSILDTKSLGSGPRSARTLIQMLEGVVDQKTLDKLFPNVRHTAAGGAVRSTGTLHSDLAKVQRYAPGRVARGAGGIGGGLVGGALTDYLINLLQNRGAQMFDGAPTLDNK